MNNDDSFARIEQFLSEQLTGKDRRKYNEKRIYELGAKKPKGIKIPTPIALGMQAKRQERAKKELQEAKNLGLYHHSIKHNWADSISSLLNKNKKTYRDKGIRMGIGKVKDGILTLSSNDIKKVQNSNRIKKRSNNGKNGKIRKAVGGNKAKSKKKRK
ncbi:1710_t:CDS:2 [Dentiscutata erythropus]|uniref:1710_t:CDS:1 n=1 Tax=Dentiscutata erythropus TaxID=1348616 RepID=A0A9N9N3L9_9GLOM|nr:1710_t:CDS:2 [Dentiscutata erythropus]